MCVLVLRLLTLDKQIGNNKLYHVMRQWAKYFYLILMHMIMYVGLENSYKCYKVAYLLSLIYFLA
jgi:hypothetical protein